jgi:hypothetical protein
MNKKTLTKSRRFAAYSLDSLIIWTISQIIIVILLPSEILKSNALTPLIALALNLGGIALSFGYYIFFWSKSQIEGTLGQLTFRLKIIKPVTVKQCIKRLAFMHISAAYCWLAISYMSIRQIAGDMQYNFLAITMLSAIAMQLIYVFYIDRVDEITGIKVVEKK